MPTKTLARTQEVLQEAIHQVTLLTSAIKIVVLLNSTFVTNKSNTMPPKPTRMALFAKFKEERKNADSLMETNNFASCFDKLLECHKHLQAFIKLDGDASENMRQKAILNTDCGVCLANMGKVQEALQYTVLAVAFNPPLYRARFYHCTYLCREKQYIEALPILEKLFAEQEEDLDLQKYFEAKQMVISCLEHCGREPEAQELFSNLYNQKRNKQEWIVMCAAFAEDAKRAKLIRANIASEDVVEVAKVTGGLPIHTNLQQFLPPANKQVQVLAAQLVTARASQDHFDVLESCTRLLQIDASNSFAYHVCRALSYFNLNDSMHAKRDCAVAYQAGNIKTTTLDQVCSTYHVTQAEIAFLRTTALEPLFSVQTKSCKCCSNTVATLKHCSRCKLVYYCNVECQKKHWSVHKAECVVANK